MPDLETHQINEAGTVRRRQRSGCWSIVRPYEYHGYHKIDLWANAERARYFVHRLVCLVFHGPPPSPAHRVRHLDGTRTNNHRDNLRWGTIAEDVEDRRRHGTLGLRKLCAENVVEMRRLYADEGMAQRAIGRLFNVSHAHVEAILAERCWKHVTSPYDDAVRSRREAARR